MKILFAIRFLKGKIRKVRARVGIERMNAWHQAHAASIGAELVSL
jgi:hypothetical protein